MKHKISARIRSMMCFINTAEWQGGRQEGKRHIMVLLKTEADTQETYIRLNECTWISSKKYALANLVAYNCILKTPSAKT